MCVAGALGPGPCLMAPGGRGAEDGGAPLRRGAQPHGPAAVVRSALPPPPPRHVHHCPQAHAAHAAYQSAAHAALDVLKRLLMLLLKHHANNNNNAKVRVLDRGLAVRRPHTVGWGQICIGREGPQRGPERRLGRRLEEVAQAVGGGYCRLQMPLRLALGVRGTVAGHRLGALEGGGGGGGAPSLPMPPCGEYTAFDRPQHPVVGVYRTRACAPPVPCLCHDDASRMTAPPTYPPNTWAGLAPPAPSLCRPPHPFAPIPLPPPPPCPRVRWAWTGGLHHRVSLQRIPLLVKVRSGWGSGTTAITSATHLELRWV